jgi:hypothetical protein
MIKNFFPIFGIFLLIFSIHIFTGSHVYFADGPAHIDSIINKTYVIQQPGYWLFAKIGGCFQDPEFGLAILNAFFVAVSAPVLFLLCRKLLVPQATAFLAAMSYVSIFFLWFSAGIHSTYASQALFPPLLIVSFILYKEKQSFSWLVICAAVYALGAGLRPSDGIFLAPLLVYLVFHSMPTIKTKFQFFLISGLLCLAWFIPTELAIYSSGRQELGSHVSALFEITSLFYAGITNRSLANMARVVVPLALAFWPVLFCIPFLPKRVGELSILAVILIWSVPGLLFLFFLYMSDAPYLVFLSGSLILAVAVSTNRKLANIIFCICICWNLGFYYLAKPIQGHNKVVLAINYYAIKYTYYGATNHWMQNISEAVLKSPWYEYSEPVEKIKHQGPL